jgi:hypothetical protein
MSRRDLIKALNNLCDEMDYHYNINCGGCCFVTAVLAEQLEYYNISFKVAITYHPTHYAIKIKDRYINRSDYNFKDLYDYNSDTLYDIYYDNDWNDYYNRKWNLIVKTRIKSIFKQYGNNLRRRCINSSS